MEATLATQPIARSDTRRFYLWMAGVFVLIAFAGFTPTYWAKVANGTFHQPTMLHVHGMVLFSWILFYFLQTALVASGRTPAHRSWGLVGISLFTLVICTIVVTRIIMMRLDDAHGFGDASRRFSAVAFSALPLMIGFFALAIANVRRPEIHKRLMYLLMATMMTPAIARVFLVILAPPGVDGGAPPPVFVATPPAFVASLLIVVAIVYDWRTRGRPSKIYIYGGLLVILESVATIFIARTDAWMGVARFLESLGG